MKENYSMRLGDIKTLAGLLTEYKIKLRYMFVNAQNEATKQEMMSRIVNVNNVLVNLCMPTEYDEREE